MDLKKITLILFSFVHCSLWSQEITYDHDIHSAFIENKGQWNKEILFKTNFSGGNLWIQNKKFLFHFQDFSATHGNHGKVNLDRNLKNKQTVVHLNFKNSNEFSISEKLNPTKNYYNYFLGNDKSKWASDVHGYNEAHVSNIYDGIDLKLIENNSSLKYEFHVRPNTDANQIELEFVGQKKAFISKNGELHIQTELGEIIEERPYTYQVINGKIKSVRCNFKIEDNIVGFDLEDYDNSEILIIDPTLIFATYSGSVTDNFGMTATYAHTGEAYSGGTIFGNQYPTPDNNAYDINSNFTVNQGNPGITDVFISKYSADGSQMIWTTFIGGGNNVQGTETVHSLIADENDNIYLFGATSSNDFPVQNGFQTNHAGGSPGANFDLNGVRHLNQGTDIYVSKFSANGQNLMGSTYIGGNQNDGINYNNSISYDSLMTNFGDNSRGEIMLDSIGNCIIASCTRSLDFPTKSAFQDSIGGQQDGVIFKLKSDLSDLIWSSYFGGSENDMCNSVKIDSSFNIVFAGGTSSSDLQKTSGTLHSTYNGGVTDGFVGKLSPDGLNLQKVSYIGTPNYDNVFFVEIDRDDNIYLLGQSLGGNFPVQNAGYVNPNSTQFICKLDSSLSTLQNSTVFGNSSPNSLNISPSAFLVDRCGSIYVSGWGNGLSNSTPLINMPITSDAFISSPPDGYDFYLMVIDKTFSNLLYGSYMGGNLAQEHVDGGTSRFDKDGVVYQSVCGGCGGYSDFPTTTNAWSALNLTSQRCNNVVFKFSFDLKPKAILNTDNIIGCTDKPIGLTNSSILFDTFNWNFGNGDSTSSITNPNITFDSSGVFSITLFINDSVCKLSDSTIISVTIYDSIRGVTSPNIYQCFPSPQTLIAYSEGTANVHIWSSNAQFTDTLNTSISDSTLDVDHDAGFYTYYVKLDNDGGCFKTDSITIHFPEKNHTITGKSTLCQNEESNFTFQNNNPLINYTLTWSNDSIIKTDPSLESIETNSKTPQYLYLNAISDSGCVISDSIFINIGTLDPTLVKAFTSDSIVPVGQTISLSSLPNNESYAWTPSSEVNSPNEQNTKAIVKGDTYFKVEVTDGICKSYDSVFVKAYQYICDDPSIFVPNAFSPNEDGNNDILYVRGNMINKLTFRIYDRWGRLLFESKDRLDGWDGTYNGKKLDPDVYDYYLQATCIDNVESIVKGNVTLLK